MQMLICPPNHFTWWHSPLPGSVLLLTVYTLVAIQFRVVSLQGLKMALKAMLVEQVWLTLTLTQSDYTGSSLLLLCQIPLPRMVHFNEFLHLRHQV